MFHLYLSLGKASVEEVHQAKRP